VRERRGHIEVGVQRADRRSKARRNDNVFQDGYPSSQGEGYGEAQKAGCGAVALRNVPEIGSDLVPFRAQILRYVANVRRRGRAGTRATDQ
jgi:hypothetical protein